jgi:hypothetical protein
MALWRHESQYPTMVSIAGRKIFVKGDFVKTGLMPAGGDSTLPWMISFLNQIESDLGLFDLSSDIEPIFFLEPGGFYFFGCAISFCSFTSLGGIPAFFRTEYATRTSSGVSK